MTIVMRAEQITRHYGATQALRGVDFDVRAGAVNVLIGENGAGKSTLMKILAGVETPSSGSVFIDNKPVVIKSVRDAARLGVSIVHQELNLCPNLTVAENIFLSRQKTVAGFLDHSAERAAASNLLKRLAQNIDPDTLVGDLRIGAQQIVEIARALADNARILILDEPTSALSASEVEVLFGIISELKRSGVAIIYISHHLEELLEIGDYITVLRDGLVVARARASEASLPWIIRNMLGREGTDVTKGSARSKGDPTLSIRNLSLLRPQGGWLLNTINLEIAKGQITAIYGLLGAGRSELLEVLAGARSPTRGEIVFNGRSLNGMSIARRVRGGIGLVPEDRQGEGLFPNFTVAQNLALSSLERFSTLGLISFREMSRKVTEMIARMTVKAPSPDISIGALSGGNQQKVVIGRCLMPGPDLLLIDEPGRGVDIGAREDIFRSMGELADQGMSLVFATSDLGEALQHADRILVMSGGRLTADLSADVASEAQLIKAANIAADFSSVKA